MAVDAQQADAALRGGGAAVEPGTQPLRALGGARPGEVVEVTATQQRPVQVVAGTTAGRPPRDPDPGGGLHDDVQAEDDGERGGRVVRAEDRGRAAPQQGDQQRGGQVGSVPGRQAGGGPDVERGEPGGGEAAAQ